MDTTKIRTKITESTVVKKSNAYYKKHKRFAPLVSFIAGFSWDSLTLSRIDRLFDNLILLAYLLLLGFSIFLIHLIDNERIKYPKVIEYREWYPLAIQFFFGGLFSAYVVFYFQSATLSKNWLFLLFLIVLLIGNEFLKNHLENFKLNIVLFFLAAFSFFTFFLPVLFQTMNTFIFLLSGLTSLLLVGALIYGLFHTSHNPDWQKYKMVGSGVIGLLLFLNILYFINWIPPVPLSLKEGGIYHHIHKNTDQYVMRFEKGSWHQFWKKSDDTFHYATGDTVFCFASVFAPTKLDKNIIHHWQVYNEKQGKWLTTDRRSYRIVGGRDGGYRGYTYKRNLQEGEWRVDVETKEKSLLGRITFTIKKVKKDSLSAPIYKTIYR